MVLLTGAPFFPCLRPNGPLAEVLLQLRAQRAPVRLAKETAIR